MAAIKSMGSAAALSLGVLSVVFLVVAMATNAWVNGKFVSSESTFKWVLKLLLKF